jgi:hypothetical protein
MDPENENSPQASPYVRSNPSHAKLIPLLQRQTPTKTRTGTPPLLFLQKKAQKDQKLAKKTTRASK